MTDFVRLEGLKELDEALARLPKEVGFKTLRSALMAASRPMFQTAKANASATGVKGFDAGATAAAMGRWTKKFAPTRTVLFIGPRNKNKKALALWNAKHGTEVKRLNHFHLVEFGSKNGPPQPYLRPAFEQTKLLVAQSVGRELSKALVKAARKLNRRSLF